MDLQLDWMFKTVKSAPVKGHLVMYTDGMTVRRQTKRRRVDDDVRDHVLLLGHLLTPVLYST
jgi:hypothetical protein